MGEISKTKAKNTDTKKSTAKKTSTPKTIKEEKIVKEVSNTEVKSTEIRETFENSKRSIFRNVWNIVFWLLIIALFAVWTTDFVRVKKDQEPIFCIKEIEHKYSDGSINECVGLGYRVYNYNRKSSNAKSQFSPFFIGMEE